MSGVSSTSTFTPYLVPPPLRPVEHCRTTVLGNGIVGNPPCRLRREPSPRTELEGRGTVSERTSPPPSPERVPLESYPPHWTTLVPTECETPGEETQIVDTGPRRVGRHKGHVYFLSRGWTQRTHAPVPFCLHGRGGSLA